MSKIRTILLVCTGNSCRSVMAGGLLQNMLAGKGDYKIITAGTGTIGGMVPTPETIRVMSEHGIDVSENRSRRLKEEMVREADLILVMQRIHKEIILQSFRGDKKKVHLLSEFGRTEEEKELVEPDISDPIGKPIEFYRRVFYVIQENIIRVAKILEEQ